MFKTLFKALDAMDNAAKTLNDAAQQLEKNAVKARVAAQEELWMAENRARAARIAKMHQK